MNNSKLIQLPFLFDRIKEFNIEQVFRLLANKYSKNIFLVGGTIRDSILSISKNIFDIDFMVKPFELSEEVAKDIANLLNTSYFVLDEERNTFRVFINKLQFDINGIRDKEIIDDMFQRDFSIDAICIPLSELINCFDNQSNNVELFDFFNGIEDIKSKKIRAHNPSTFIDDPTRILRAFRLVSETGFTIDNISMEEMIKSKLLLNNVSKERIRDEFSKILTFVDSYKIIRLIDEESILNVIYPFLELFKDIDIKYPENVSLKIHSLETLMYLEMIIQRIIKGDFPYHNEILFLLDKEIIHDRSILVSIKLAALLHDTGKPLTLSFEGTRMRFFNHEEKGAEYITDYLKELKLSNKEIDLITALVISHMRPHNLSNVIELTERSKYRYFRDTEEKGIYLLLLALADAYATRRCKMGELVEYEEFISKMFSYYFKPRKEPIIVLVDGFEIMNMLNIPPSKQIGTILEDLKEAQSLGEVSSKEEAIQYIKNKYSN